MPNTLIRTRNRGGAKIGCMLTRGKDGSHSQLCEIRKSSKLADIRGVRRTLKWFSGIGIALAVIFKKTDWYRSRALRYALGSYTYLRRGMRVGVYGQMKKFVAASVQLVRVYRRIVKECQTECSLKVARPYFTHMRPRNSQKKRQYEDANELMPGWWRMAEDDWVMEI